MVSVTKKVLVIFLKVNFHVWEKAFYGVILFSN